MRSSMHPSLLLVCVAFRLAAAQQVGSFFTAIYLNGAPIASNQESCGNMGQSQYCCGQGQSCAWDDGGKVACCAVGSSCGGSAYGQSAGAGAGQYYRSSSSSWYPQQQVTTVYQAQSPGCNCESTTNYNGGAVVPIVPVTVATVLTSSYYQVPTSTLSPSTQTTTTTPGAVVAAVVTTAQTGACPSGYKTFTEANVGAPVRTVGCNVIIDSAASTCKGCLRKWIWALSLVSMIICSVGHE